jgi:MFS family permease
MAPTLTESSSRPTGWRCAIRALRVRNYRLFAFGNLVSVTGTWMQLIAQNWLVLRLTGSTTALGITVALQSIPCVVLSLYGGAIADRFPKRRLLTATQTSLAALAALLGALVVTGVVEVWMVYALAVAVGCVSAVDVPTASAFGTELVTAEDLSNAAALGSATNSTGRILGMAAAGVAVASVGVAPVFFANAASYLAVVVALACMRPHELHSAPPARGVEGRIRHAVRALRREPVVLGALALAFVAAAFGRNYQVTMAAMSSAVFHRGAAGYGMASTVFAIGAFAGALLAARLPRLGLRLLFTTACIAGVLEMLAASTPGIDAFAACILPIAITAVVIDTTVGVVVALHVDAGVRGRALALLAVTSTAGTTVGGPMLGWSAQHLGARASLLAGGAVCVVATVAIGVAVARRHAGAHADQTGVVRLATRIPAIRWRRPEPGARLPRLGLDDAA